MQNPVGFIYNAKSGQAELTDIWAVLTNKVAAAGYPHILAGALLAGAAVIVGIAAWHLARRQHIEVMRASLRFGLFMALAAGIGTTITGDTQGKVMTEVQPMKMAAAEALWDSKSDASFSLFTIGTRDATRRSPYGSHSCSRSWRKGTFMPTSKASTTYRPSMSSGLGPATTRRTSPPPTGASVT